MWKATRVGAVVFVVGLPMVVLCMIPCVRPHRTSREWISKACIVVQALVVGFVLAFWAHLVPCFWLACDLGPDDDGYARGLVWFGGWPLTTLITGAVALRCKAVRLVRFEAATPRTSEPVCASVV